MEHIIQITIQEFEKFTYFIHNEQPKISAKLGVLGKKDSYKLNKQLRYKKKCNAPNYNQDQYHTIDLMFSLALAGELYVKASNEKGIPSLKRTDAMHSFEKLTTSEKYTFLLQTYWTKYDFKGKVDSFSSIKSFHNMLISIANAEKGQRITKDELGLNWNMFSSSAAFLHHIRFFGFGELEEIEGAKGKYEDSVKAFIPNEFGIQTCSFLLTVLHLWGHKDIRFLLTKDEVEFNTKDPFDFFKTIFDDDSVINTVISKNDYDRSGVYTFKVSLTKDCWRKINVSHEHTLSQFHRAIQKAFDFDDDHLYAFYINGNRRTGQPIYCMDVQDERKTTEETHIDDLGLYKGQKLYYLFDFGDMWEFEILLTNISKDTIIPPIPEIIEIKGESPDQYNSW